MVHAEEQGHGEDDTGIPRQVRKSREYQIKENSRQQEYRRFRISLFI